MDFFETGKQSSLYTILQSKEKRRKYQVEILREFSGATLINFKCNIPGKIKNNEVIKQIFNIGNVEIKKTLDSLSETIIYYKEIDQEAGPESFYVVSMLPTDVKSHMINLENQDGLGRIFDIDVLFSNSNLIGSISRVNLNKKARKCFVCEGDAKECGRSQAHSMAVLYSVLTNMVINDGRITY